MELTLSAVIEAARLRRAGVTAEVAGYIVLLAVKQMSPAPCHVSTDAFVLTETGDLRLVDRGVAGSDRDAETQLRQLLSTLAALSQTTSPALKIASERAAVGDLGALEAELAAALIPINHAAARRALARLYRETHKSRASLSNTSEARSEPTPSPRPLAVSSIDARPQELSPAATPAPASAARAWVAPAPPPAADLDIDVDVAAFDDIERGPPTSSFAPAALAVQAASLTPVLVRLESSLPDSAVPEAEPSSHRSDLRELLAGFLSHTRCEEQMTADLRRMIGLDAAQSRRPPSGAPPPLLAVPTPGR